jgi:hypothetical protein
MIMKSHILAALREEFDQWQDLIAALDEERLTTPLSSAGWSPKDIIMHLWAWQQRTIARCEAALFDREPVFPRWYTPTGPDPEGSTDQVNAWIYDTYHDQAWSEVHHNWQAGYQQFLEIAQRISERDMLDSDRYSWLKGYPIAIYLISSYDHHQEHFEKLQAMLNNPQEER